MREDGGGYGALWFGLVKSVPACAIPMWALRKASESDDEMRKQGIEWVSRYCTLESNMMKRNVCLGNITFRISVNEIENLSVMFLANSS